jgi:2-ketoarginine methyltransferase
MSLSGQRLDLAVPETVEARLVESLQPIRQYALATCIYHLFESGLFDALAASGGQAVAVLADRFALDHDRLATLLQFLVNEGFLCRSAEHYALTRKGLALADYRAWYTMLIGGYGATFLQVGDKLRRGSGSASRVAHQVGIGSCGISHYDSIPLTQRLMAEIPGGVRSMLDLGCGNGLYLVEFCRAVPDLLAWGAEPDRAGYEAAVALVEREQLSHRIHLTCAGAREFFHTPNEFTPDMTVLGFVLHEILGQDGEDGVLAFLRELTGRYPDIHIIAIEVDAQMANPRVMRHELALAYYNAYYLLHPFTGQRLESRAFWTTLFDRAGLELLATDTVDPAVDSTELEIGFLLRRRRDPMGGRA